MRDEEWKLKAGFPPGDLIEGSLFAPYNEIGDRFGAFTRELITAEIDWREMLHNENSAIEIYEETGNKTGFIGGVIEAEGKERNAWSDNAYFSRGNNTWTCSLPYDPSTPPLLKTYQEELRGYCKSLSGYVTKTDEGLRQRITIKSPMALKKIAEVIKHQMYSTETVPLQQRGHTNYGKKGSN